MSGYNLSPTGKHLWMNHFSIDMNSLREIKLQKKWNFNRIL